LQSVGVGGVVAQVGGGVEIVARHQTGEGAAFVNLQRWAQLEDPAALEQAQSARAGDAPDDRPEGGSGGVRVVGLAVVKGERGSLVVEGHAGRQGAFQGAPRRLKRRAVRLEVGWDFDLIASPPFQAVIAHVDQAGDAHPRADIVHRPPGDHGDQRQLLGQRRQQRAVARRHLGRVRLGDDGADRPVHVGDDPQPGRANQRGEQPARSTLPMHSALHLSDRIGGSSSQSARQQAARRGQRRKYSWANQPPNPKPSP